MYKTIKSSIKPLIKDPNLYKLVKAEIKKVLAAKEYSISYTLDDSDFEDVEKAFKELGIPLTDKDTSWDVDVYFTINVGHKSADYYVPDDPTVVEDLDVILTDDNKKEHDIYKYLTASAIKRIEEKALDYDPSEAMAQQSIFDEFVDALYQVVGNKVYMRDIEKLFKSLNNVEVTPTQKDSMHYLIRGLRGLQQK